MKSWTSTREKEWGLKPVMFILYIFVQRFRIASTKTTVRISHWGNHEHVWVCVSHHQKYFEAISNGGNVINNIYISLVLNVTGCCLSKFLNLDGSSNTIETNENFTILRDCKKWHIGRSWIYQVQFDKKLNKKLGRYLTKHIYYQRTNYFTWILTYITEVVSLHLLKKQ